jgi:hypothetical protein
MIGHRSSPDGLEVEITSAPRGARSIASPIAAANASAIGNPAAGSMNTEAPQIITSRVSSTMANGRESTLPQDPPEACGQGMTHPPGR